MKNYLILALLSGLFLLQSTAVQAQCAMCRSTLESNVSDGNVSVAAQLNLGIIYLFVTPYILIMLIGFLWYRASKKKGKRFNPASYFKK